MDAKKVILLLLLAAAGGVALFLFISERFTQQQLRTRTDELAGNMSPGDMAFYNTALDRQWFHGSMPPHGENPWGREQWKEEWKTTLGEAGFRRHVVSTQVLPSSVETVPPGGRVTETEWVIGVPGAWGTTIRYRMVWLHSDGDWKIARIDEMSRVDGPPPPMPERVK